MAGSDAPSLKSRNTWQLRFLLLVNVLLCIGVFFGTSIGLSDLTRSLATIAESVGLFSVAGLFTIALCQAVPETWKHVFVFWRFKHVLPGHRAFSIYGPRDPRVDLTQVKAKYGDLPTSPTDQNKLWYGMLKQMEKAHPYILENHRIFLLLRDASVLAAILLVVVSVGILALGIHGPARLWLPGILLLEVLITNLAANNTGVELVRNVLAAESAKE